MYTLIGVKCKSSKRLRNSRGDGNRKTRGAVKI